MIKMLTLTAIAVVSISMSVCAQKINTDSLSLISKISEDQLKMGKLQNKMDQMTKDKEDGASQAQLSADKNKTAANTLSDNPTDKKNARQADNAASDARSDAKKARKTSGNLDDLNNAIAKLKDKIAKEQAKLNVYIKASSGTITPLPVETDSTKHN